jgi:hypothetical protein
MTDIGTATAPNGATILHARRTVSFASAPSASIIEGSAPVGGSHYTEPIDTDVVEADEADARLDAYLAAYPYRASYRAVYAPSVAAGTTATGVAGSESRRDSIRERARRLRVERPSSRPEAVDDETGEWLGAMYRAQLETLGDD